MTVLNDINESDDSSSCPDKTRCENNDGSFNCPCLNGYNDIDGICVDDNEYVVVHSCNENTRRSNTDGSYQCFCESGLSKTKVARLMALLTLNVMLKMNNC